MEGCACVYIYFQETIWCRHIHALGMLPQSLWVYICEDHVNLEGLLSLEPHIPSDSYTATSSAGFSEA